jgi:hypothetical protein
MLLINTLSFAILAANKHNIPKILIFRRCAELYACTTDIREIILFLAIFHYFYFALQSKNQYHSI